MGLKIYTYSNPYEIDCEPFWNEIKDCAHFCVSQTMVNGMNQTYPLLKTRQATATIRTLVNSLYENWDDINTNVRQIMEVDNAISELNLQTASLENVKRSLLFNTRSIVSCIRMFKELSINSDKMSSDKLNIDQRYLVELYKIIDKKDKSSFDFERVKSKSIIEKAIDEALKYHKDNVDLSLIERDRIVIHGIHQFTPAMLCAIEDISEYKIYYVNNDATKVVSESFEPVNKQDKKEMVNEFISELTVDPTNPDYQRALPAEIEILGYTFGEADQLILNFSASYYTSLTGVREILTRAAVVKTFCQIEGIEYVEFNVMGRLLASGEMTVNMMKASDFVETTGFTQNAYVTLYFSNKDGNALIESRREVDYDGIISVEQLIINQLIAGPVEREYGMISTLNPETKLNSVATKDGICYVDFNEKFLENLNGISEKVTIYSVVNSLVELTNVNKVQFLINNKKVIP